MIEEVIYALENLSDKFGIYIDWSNPNTVPYIQDLLSRFMGYQTIIDIITIVLLLGICGVLLVLIPKIYKYDKEVFGPVAAVVGAVLILGAFVIIVSSIFSIVRNIYMPELTLLNYIKTLLTIN